MTSHISSKASFENIRYAQLWEDADVLTGALGNQTGNTLVSICSAGDNALAMLTLDPKKVVVVDLSQAQIECLNLRISAYKTLDHTGFLELMGSRTSARRLKLLSQVLEICSPQTRAFWQNLESDVEAFGVGGCGKFERYFRLFKTRILPFVHSQKTIVDIFVPRPIEERRKFLDERFNNWRWKLLVKVFFSRWAMGKLGRDQAFFDYVEGSVGDHVQRRIRHAAIDCDPSENPYLHWIMYATHNQHVPMTWRAEHYDTIRARLDRLEIHHGSLETFISTGSKADGFNLSDIFEYMPPSIFEDVYASVVSASNPGAKLVYWNMMAPRRVPPKFAGNMTTRKDLESVGKANDKAFFYSDFVVEEVRAS
jgi:S-adenosylmethionine-diacylglycerol 3-amino-3-carboxypropyl transferase